MAHASPHAARSRRTSRLALLAFLWLAAGCAEPGDAGTRTDAGTPAAPDSAAPAPAAVRPPAPAEPETALVPGVSEQRVLALLGEPRVRETSRALNQTDEPLRVGTSWRYEQPEGHLVVDFDERGSLLEARRTGPLPASLVPERTWSLEGTLAHAYLLHASEDTLLVLGDDGGFSGMHYYSNLAGVDRESGELRWRLDTGYAGIDAVADPHGRYATVLTRVDFDSGEHVNRLRRLELRDGRPVWELVLPDEQEFVTLRGVQGAVVTSSQPFQDESDGRLRVWDADTGQLRWERHYGQPYKLLNEGAGDPYILLLQVDTLDAIDPLDGKTVWTLRGLGATDSDPYANPFAAPRTDPFAPDDPERWITLGADRYLIRVDEGTVLAKYRIIPGETVEAIDDRRWLIRKPLDDDRHWMATAFDTVLYDAIAGKELWTVSGSIHGAVPDGDRLIALYDGQPAAIDRQTGRIQWQAAIEGGPHGQAPPVTVLSALENGTILILAGSDIIALDGRDGRALYRVQDSIGGYAETHGDYLRSHLAAEAPDGSLFIGSANGRFSRLRLPSPASLQAG